MKTKYQAEDWKGERRNRRDTLTLPASSNASMTAFSPPPAFRTCGSTRWSRQPPLTTTFLMLSSLAKKIETDTILDVTASNLQLYRIKCIIYSPKKSNTWQNFFSFLFKFVAIVTVDFCPPWSNLLALEVSQQVDITLLCHRYCCCITSCRHGNGNIFVVQSWYLPEGRHTLLTIRIQEVTWGLKPTRS